MDLLGAGNQDDAYSGKPLFFLLIFLFLEILMITIFLPVSWVENTIYDENRSLVNIAGYESANHAWEVSQSWYDYLFVESGITKTISEVMIPSDEERVNSRGLETLGKYDFFPWVERRGEVLSLVIQQTFQRAYVAYSWIVQLLWLCIPAIAEGVIARSIKKHNFDYPSPIAHRYSVDILVICIAISILSLLIPFAISSLLIPMLFVAIIPIALIVIISNLPKSI